MLAVLFVLIESDALAPFDPSVLAKSNALVMVPVKVIPFVIVVPGIIAPVLFREKLQINMETAVDQAYPMLIRELIGEVWRGFVLAALAGAVISSLASMLNSASTIFTMDLYKRLFKQDASQQSLVVLGRTMTIVFMLIACALAPALAEYRRAVENCAAPGVVQDALRDLETIQAAGMAGLEPVFELLQHSDEV